MPSKDPLSRSKLLALAEVDEGTMIFWLRHELIQSDGPRSGRGKHFRFPFYEANIAAIMRQLRQFGSSIDVLKGVAAIYREAISWGLSFQLDYDDLIAMLILSSSAIEHRHKVAHSDDAEYSENDATDRLMRHLAAAGVSITPKVLAASNTVTEEDHAKHHSALLEVLMQPSDIGDAYPAHFWISADGWKRGFGKYGQRRASDDGAYATIAIDMTALLYRVWNKPCVV